MSRPLHRYHRLALALLAGIVIACAPAKPAFKGTDVSGVEWGGNFSLLAHSGKRVQASDYTGKVVVLFFGYTHCPDICAPTLQRLAVLMKQLGSDAARVQVLFVTVDPTHDTAVQLASFVPKFHPSFIGLTGSEQEIGQVTSDYKVGYQKNPATTAQQPLVDHTGGLMVKDTKGKLRLLWKNDLGIEDMAHDLRRLLQEAG